ncbi:MAG: type III-A CRISPR-associated RAMP protein Csm4 [Syntrophomonadaceae bacterium]|nr:type III-A CRISPR-associated RAMP protein Csm4 [Syntrophomonadaceae bacterium]
MDYSLYKLEFTTPLHIGRDTGGASLDNGQMAIHSDTVFSALCCEAARGGRLEELVSYFTEGVLVLSDALPYAGDELFFPKPILHTTNLLREGDSGLKKKLKDIDYIPLSGFDNYLENLATNNLDLDSLRHNFGQLNTLTRVAIRGNTAPLPYHVACWRFAKGCGLYVVVAYMGETARNLFEYLLARLGLSGVGGKRSSGWGKFSVQRDIMPQDLRSRLEDVSAPYQMLLGTALPVDSEIEEILQDGWYTVIRRGGFIDSDTYSAGQLKKKTTYMLGPGSCLRCRFQGGMHDVSDNGCHPVWRLANSLFVGVNI